ncbi:DNA internalization-related competence protein ComEC/Rec2 [Vibrio sp. SM6]|uniref:DNA internalization-related competence protein ComEC/Rec2 n=1 Tax=Vibrio agarilyticus TaxID=2726741 RepID=A0A7X8TQK4_9VIBR|nr:DNA internalization-related competence protein ComEC/Rec2 [Vibrio agarilyticus]NLS13040.1 DNA internalization-related competence protein ComEC/Rec2 [Vibrio agarilyticus]
MTLLFDTRCWILFIVTILTTRFWPGLPHWLWTLPLVALIVLILKYRRYIEGLGVFLALLIIITEGNRLQWQSQSLFRAGVHSTINARVDSPFIPITNGYEGIVSINMLNGTPIEDFRTIKVLARTALPLSLGDHITVKATFTPLYGLRNRVGFDREQFYFSRGIVAKALLDTKDSFRVVSQANLRAQLLAKVTEDADSLPHFPLIKALGFGLRDELTVTLWQQLQGSGLIHLLSISGLHIAMAFAFGAFVGAGMRLILPRAVALPWLCGFVLSCCYAWLADFSIPTVRALLFCLLITLFKWRGLVYLRWYLFLWVMALNLMFDPFASLSSSFWLSYGAVAAVILALIPAKTRDDAAPIGWRIFAVIKRAMAFQLRLSALLLPLSIIYFQGVSSGTIVFNLVFIPWFTLIMVPLLFVAMLCSGLSISLPAFGWLAAIVWPLVDRALAPVTFAIEPAANAWLTVSAYWYPLIGLLLVALLLWEYLSTLGRAIGILISAVYLGWPFSHYQDDKLRLEIFDVGHGLAVAFHRNGHSVLYDTGRAWPNGSIAQQVLMPNFSAIGLMALDGLVVSHDDNDHAGGTSSVMQKLSPRWVSGSAPSILLEKEQASMTLKPQLRPCVKGQSWEWQQTHWQVLWPPKLVTRAYNPQSCVIRVTDLHSQKRVLLTGDITAVAEWLLLREPEQLSAEVVLVPHHGSATSSLSRFVNAVDAHYAIASLARGNQWGLPQQSVVSRYTEQGSRWLETARHGQISLTFEPNGISVETQRHDTFEPWYRQMMRNQVE